MIIILNLFNKSSFVILFLIGSSISIDFSFPSALTLTNGNILIIEELGIYIFNPTNNDIREEYRFPEEDKIKNKQDLSRVILKRSQGYIFGLINYKIFIFNGEGERLVTTTQKFTDQNPQHFTLTPIVHSGNIYPFIIAFFDSNTYLNLTSYYYEISSKTIFIIGRKIEYTYLYYDYGYKTYYFENRGLTCEYMIYTSMGSYYFKLICFFVVSYNSKYYLMVGFYEINSDLSISSFI